jgi:hypothetical protein
MENMENKTKFKNKCELLNHNYKECVSLNKYIMGDYYNDKICKYIKIEYLKECTKILM